jgi:hypothetical protein
MGISNIETHLSCQNAGFFRKLWSKTPLAGCKNLVLEEPLGCNHCLWSLDWSHGDEGAFSQNNRPFGVSVAIGMGRLTDPGCCAAVSQGKTAATTISKLLERQRMGGKQ